MKSLRRISSVLFWLSHCSGVCCLGRALASGWVSCQRSKFIKEFHRFACVEVGEEGEDVELQKLMAQNDGDVRRGRECERSETGKEFLFFLHEEKICR